MHGYARPNPQRPADPTQDENENVVAFVQKLQEVAPPIPDALIHNIIAQAGCPTSDPRVARIFNIIAQKFIVDVLNDFGEKKDIQLEDVRKVLTDRGFAVHRPEFLMSTTENEERPGPEEPAEFDRDPSLAGF